MNCVQFFDSLALQWMDFFNSTIVPFIFMILLSIALIHTVRASRLRVHSNASSSSQSKRDNRFAISVISLNLIFFILNLPIVIYDLISVNTQTSELFDFVVEFLYYSYYASNFYVQLFVNSEFKREFLKLLNLKQIGNYETEIGTANAND